MAAAASRPPSCAALLYSLLLSAAAPAAPVSATLEPGSVAVGESAILTITTLGSGIEPVDLPVVADLKFRVLQQSRRTEIIRGATVATITTVVRVTALAPGGYSIPGLVPGSQPLMLRVYTDAAANSARPKAGAGAGAGAGGIVMGADGAAFVRLLVPKSELYVGESVPVSIEVGMRAGFVKSVNGLPTLSVPAFTLNNLSRQPERVEKTIDGKPFAVLTWHSELAAIKPGAFSLSVQAPLTVKIRTRPQKETQLEDQLGDPFLQNIFGASVQKELQLASPPTSISVQALPAGRPPGFSGAVGSFRIASSIAPATAAIGDPLTLRMSVSGSGNFDRVDSTMLGSLEHWRTYPPTSHFTAGDAIGYRGEKVFEQPIVPLQGGRQRLPVLTFSYFDPSTGRFETAGSAPLELWVGAPADGRSPAVAAGAAIPGLRPDHVPDGLTAGTLVPVYLRPWFLAGTASLAFAFLAGAVLLPRRTGTADDAVLRALLTRMEAAARQGNDAAFLRPAREALQFMVSGKGHSAPDPAHAREIRELLALADAAEYSGRQAAHDPANPPSAVDAPRWLRIVRERLGAGPE